MHPSKIARKYYLLSGETAIHTQRGSLAEEANKVTS